MSETLNIALVAEGSTDRVVIEAALNALLPKMPFVLNQLRPEYSDLTGQIGPGGWSGVYLWCKQIRERSAQLDSDPIFIMHDAVIVQIDADVSGFTYQSASIKRTPTDKPLPCSEACPPASASVEKLRTVLGSWLPRISPTSKIIFCIPSKNMEAWVASLIYPGDTIVTRGIECYPNPESRFSTQPKSKRIRKNFGDYSSHANEMRNGWLKAMSRRLLGEAARFSEGVRKTFPQPTK